MKKIIAICGIALVLVGCSSMSNQESAILQAQISQPTFKIQCPDNGCNFSNFEYHDPNKAVSMPTNGYDVAMKAIGTTSSVLLGTAPYFALSNAFKYMNDGETTIDNSSVDSSDNSVTETTSSVDRSDNSVRETTTIDRSDRSNRSDNSTRETIAEPSP